MTSYDAYAAPYAEILGQETLVGTTYERSCWSSTLIIREGLGNAKIQGLTTQLDLTGNKYNIALVSIQTFVCHGDRSYFVDNVFCRAFTTCGFPDVFLNIV